MAYDSHGLLLDCCMISMLGDAVKQRAMPRWLSCMQIAKDRPSSNAVIACVQQTWIQQTWIASTDAPCIIECTLNGIDWLTKEALNMSCHFDPIEIDCK